MEVIAEPGYGRYPRGEAMSAVSQEAEPAYDGASEDPTPPASDDSTAPGAGPRRERPPRRTAVIAVIVAVVVIVAAIGALYLSGIGPFSRSSTPPGVTGSGQTYDAATAAANQSASAYGSGPWTPIFAVGVDMPGSLLVSTALPADLLGNSCAGTSLAPSPTVTFEGFNGALASGAAPDWMFMEVGAPNTVLVEVVLGGQATVLEAYSGSGCSLFVTAGGLPSTIVDSSTVAQSFLSGGGNAFIAQHPGGVLTLNAFGAFGVDSWGVGYSTCPANGAAATGSQYNYSASFYANNGSATGAPKEVNNPHCGGLDLTGGAAVTTPGLAPLSSVLQVSAVTGTVSATATSYAVTITQAASFLVWDNLAFSIVNATGSVVASTTADPVTISAASGCAIATGSLGIPYYLPPTTGTCRSGATGGGAPVGTGDLVTITSSGTLPGSVDALMVTGAPQYHGALNLTIPAVSTPRLPLSSGLGLSAVDASPLGLATYSVNVTSAAAGLVLPEVSFQILNSTGMPAAGPDFVYIAASSGCQIADGSVNSSTYYAPIFSGCATGTGPTAPLSVGDVVSITSSTALAGSGYEFVAYGQNLYNSSVERPFSGVLKPLASALSIGPVTETNSSGGYTYAVNVTSAAPGLEWEDLALGIYDSLGVGVQGPTTVVVENGTGGCEIASGQAASDGYSAPASDACSGQTLGGSAPVRVGESAVLESTSQLVGRDPVGLLENYTVTGERAYGGVVVSPMPVFGGPIKWALTFASVTQGSDAGGYYYNVTLASVNTPVLVRDLAVTATNTSYQVLPGPYLVNVTEASGCVLATGLPNSTSYAVPTDSGCALGTLGGGAALTGGDSIIVYSTVALSGEDLIYLTGEGTYWGYTFAQIA